MNLPTSRQERDAIAARKTWLIAGLAVVMVAVSLGISWWVTPTQGAHDLPPIDDTTLRYRYRDPGHPPREQRERWHRHLQSWGWVDREAGIAHVPVQRAMQGWLAGRRVAADSPTGPDEEDQR